MEVLVSKSIWIIATVMFLNIFTPSAQAGLWFEIPPELERFFDLGITARSNSLKNTFKILVWNTFKGQKENFKRDFLNLSKDKDLVILQEAFMTSDLEPFFNRETDFNFWFASSFLYKKNRFKTGVMTGGKVEAVEKFYTEAPYKEIVGNTPKVTLYTKYNINGFNHPLMVVNIHAINSVTAKMHHAHIDQVLKILASHPGPAVLAGDFNAWSRKKFDYLQDQAKSSGFSEVYFPDGFERMQTFGYPLDFVFLKKLCAKQAEVHGDLDGSDHKALSVTAGACH